MFIICRRFLIISDSVAYQFFNLGSFRLGKQYTLWMYSEIKAI